MELGAMVCKPRHPLCNQCPVFRYCEAKRLGLQEKLPVRPPGKPVPHYHVVAGIIWKKDRFLITLREPRGLLGGLWEFPGGKVQEGESLKEGLIREVQEELHIHVTVNDCLVSVNHAYTHFKITLHMFHCRIRGGMIHLKSAVQFKWIRPEDLDQYACPAANRKVLEVLREKKKGGF